jgi:hypothetical protein
MKLQQFLVSSLLATGASAFSVVSSSSSNHQKQSSSALEAASRRSFFSTVATTAVILAPALPVFAADGFDDLSMPSPEEDKAAQVR